MKLPSAIILACCMLSSQVFAASVTKQFTVTQIISDATKYNGCLIGVSPDPADDFATCATSYVTLGCDGTAGPSKAAASRNYSNAQLGFITNTKVVLRVYDVKPAGNAYCLADRVDNTTVSTN